MCFHATVLIRWISPWQRCCRGWRPDALPGGATVLSPGGVRACSGAVWFREIMTPQSREQASASNHALRGAVSQECGGNAIAYARLDPDPFADRRSAICR